MSKLYWKLRQSMSMASLKQGAVMVRNGRSKINRYTFYSCNRWGVGWHTRGRRL